MQNLILRFPNAKTYLIREDNRHWELKHLSTSRKRKQLVIPLLAASEKGKGQTESSFERENEMW